MGPELSKTPFVWSSKAGQQLCLEILLPKLPYHPHDYQLEGICASLDGKDVLAVLPTGVEKTGLLFMHMLVVQRVLEELSLCPEKKYPKHALMLVVCPTNYLEYQTVHKLSYSFLSSTCARRPLSSSRMV
jgi:hypothetical protein